MLNFINEKVFSLMYQLYEIIWFLRDALFLFEAIWNHLQQFDNKLYTCIFYSIWKRISSKCIEYRYTM